MSADVQILLIEDDPAIAESLSEGLGGEGYAVHWESTGVAGVAYARDRSPRLIILDVRLPDGEQYKTLEYMQQVLDVAVTNRFFGWLACSALYCAAASVACWKYSLDSSTLAW